MSPPANRRLAGTGALGRGPSRAIDIDEQQDELELLLAESPTIVYRRTPTAPYGFTFVSRNVEQLLGLRAEDLIAPQSALHGLVFADDSPLLYETLARVGQSRVRLTYRALDARGALRFIQDEMRLVVDDEGKPSHIVGHLIDVTDRQQLVDDLVRSEERHALAVQGAQAGLWDLDVPSNRIYLSPRAIEMFGYDEDEVGPYASLDFFLGHIHGDDRAYVESALSAHLEGRGPFDVEYRALRKDASVRWFHLCGQANWVGDLRPARVAGWLSDISERRRLEDELRQAQKMEAIGQLAGGVAHDFNNLLSVILGCAQLVGQELPEEHPASEDAREIVQAAKRAAALTSQLLAFSRQQRMEPKVVELDLAIRNLEGMLRRLIGEDYELVTTPSPDPLAIRIDPGQFEQVVLNLVVNARDAVRDSRAAATATNRQIRISTGCVDEVPPEATVGSPSIGPGPYVVLTVKDSGHGMDAATRARIFEPFFTTKEKGRGTGLGLSSVYGIVTQSGGRISVESAPGQGTTFRIYFSRCEDPDGLPAGGEASLVESVGSRGGTILLAEDDDQLRHLARKILEGSGCTVLAARDGIEALALASELDGPIDLLVSDIVMPGMSGPQLHVALCEKQPAVPVLFMTGYADRQTLPDEGAAILQKPFSAHALVARVRDTIAAVANSRLDPADSQPTWQGEPAPRR